MVSPSRNIAPLQYYTSITNVPFYVAYVPIKGRLYELDGLREGPLDHGAIPSGQDWIATVKPIIEARISKYQAGEIHFNLMAVIQDKLVNYNYLVTDRVVLKTWVLEVWVLRPFLHYLMSAIFGEFSN